MTPRELFLANLDTIGRIVDYLGRRHSLSTDRREEVESYVRLRLMEDDYRILRRFRGESKISTYLSVVIQRCFLDYRDQEWGRWRASAAAKRLGAVAMQLERLLYRDRCSFHEAAQILIRSHKARVTEEELERIYVEIPVRQDHIVFGEDVLEVAGPSADTPDPSNLHLRHLVSSMEETLQRALSGLSARDRLILRMRFVDDLSVADIARTLGIDATPLYPRVHVISHRLRKSLKAEGIGRSEAHSLLRSHYRMDLDIGEKDENLVPRPSKVKTES